MTIKISDYLKENNNNPRILTNLEAKTKEVLLFEFSKLFYPANEDMEQKVFHALKKREECLSTGIGHGYAIPHTRAMNIERSEVAIITTMGTDFKSQDNKPEPVYFAFGVINPAGDVNNYLRVLEKITELINKDIFYGIIEKIKNNKKVTQEEISYILSEYEK